MPGLQIDLEVLNRLRFSTHLQQYQSTSDIDVVSNDNDDDLVSVSELFARADPDPAPTAATATPRDGYPQAADLGGFTPREAPKRA